MRVSYFRLIAFILHPSPQWGRFSCMVVPLRLPLPSDTLAMTVSVSTPVPETRVGSGNGCTRAWEGDGVCVGGPRDEARKVKRGDRGGEEHARKARSPTTVQGLVCHLTRGCIQGHICADGSKGHYQPGKLHGDGKGRE